MSFSPNHNHMLDVLSNRKPSRLPLYEHIVDVSIMEKILHKNFADLWNGPEADQKEFFNNYCRFFFEMTYDTVSFEMTIVDFIPGHGAIFGGMKGPIQNREDFQKFPWDELPTIYWQTAETKFDLLGHSLPRGMKAVGGVGNGVFEIIRDLVGYEYLCYMMADDPELVSDLCLKIGDLMFVIWKKFLQKYSDSFAVCRFGDDLGYKTGLMLSPSMIRQYITPQYQRIVRLVHAHHKPFLWHSCGCIFDIMDEMIQIGINAKHSNEDIYAPFEKWINLYGGQIGLLGGIDLNILCLKNPDEIFNIVVERGKEYRRLANGFALGSGNSIPDFVPPENYLAMVEAAKFIRSEEEQSRPSSCPPP